MKSDKCTRLTFIIMCLIMYMSIIFYMQSLQPVEQGKILKHELTKKKVICNDLTKKCYFKNKYTLTRYITINNTMYVLIEECFNCNKTMKNKINELDFIFHKNYYGEYVLGKPLNFPLICILPQIFMFVILFSLDDSDNDFTQYGIPNKLKRSYSF